MEVLIILGCVFGLFLILIAIYNDAEKNNNNSEQAHCELKGSVNSWEGLSQPSEYQTVVEYVKSFEGRIEEWKKLGDILDVDGHKIRIEDIKQHSYDNIDHHYLLIPKLVFMKSLCGYDRYTVVGYDDFKIQGFNLDCVKQLEELLKDAVVAKSTLFKLKEKFPRIKNGWYSVNNGQYYLNRECEFEPEYLYEYNFNLYKFEDWSEVNITGETFDIETLTPCDNPKKAYWKHFLELYMKAKKIRQDLCHSFVDEVLSQQKEYNDLQLQYDMMPSAPISDVVSFNNFCKVVSKEHGFKDYEIQNYLLLKQGG